MSKQKQSNQIHIVLGLGCSGISAAKLLKSEGKNVLVLENNSNKNLLNISNKLKSKLNCQNKNNQIKYILYLD